MFFIVNIRLKKRFQYLRNKSKLKIISHKVFSSFGSFSTMNHINGESKKPFLIGVSGGTASGKVSNLIKKFIKDLGIYFFQIQIFDILLFL